MQEIWRSLSQVSGRTVLLTWLTCVAVAVSAGAGLLRPPALLTETPAALIRLSAVIALVMAFVMMHRIGRRAGGRQSSAIGPALLRAATLMAVLAVAAGLTPPPRVVPDADDAETPASSETRAARPDETGGVPAPPNRPPPARAETREGGTGVGAPPPPPPILDRPEATGAGFNPGPWLRRIVDLLFLLVLLAGVVLVAKRRAPARRGPREFTLEPPTPSAAYQPQEELEPFSLDGRTPREQVTLAYRHLLVLLAEAGVARGQEEAPYEYARRAKQTLAAVGKPLLRITQLYVLAQFSLLSIEQRHGKEAAHLLREGSKILRELAEAESPTETGAFSMASP